MSLSRGDRVITTADHNWISRGTKGVVVEPGWALNHPKISFENGKTQHHPEEYLARI